MTKGKLILLILCISLIGGCKYQNKLNYLDNKSSNEKWHVGSTVITLNDKDKATNLSFNLTFLGQGTIEENSSFALTVKATPSNEHITLMTNIKVYLNSSISKDHVIKYENYELKSNISKKDLNNIIFEIKYTIDNTDYIDVIKSSI